MSTGEGEHAVIAKNNCPLEDQTHIHCSLLTERTIPPCANLPCWAPAELFQPNLTHCPGPHEKATQCTGSHESAAGLPT